MTHNLKTWPHYFESLLSEQKRFEIRRNDRDFQVGDQLVLEEWDNETESFTGRKLIVIVEYILHGPIFGIEKGYCVMSIARND